MTEEATNNTEKQPTSLHTYWYSNDDEPCKPVYTLVPFEEVSWPLVAEEPDMTLLKNPKYDWRNQKWIETDSSSQGTQIALMQNTIDTLSKQNSNLTDENASLKKQIEAGQKQIGDLGIMVAKSMAKPTVPTENGGTN